MHMHAIKCFIGFHHVNTMQLSEFVDAYIYNTLCMLHAVAIHACMVFHVFYISQHCIAFVYVRSLVINASEYTCKPNTSCI